MVINRPERSGSDVKRRILRACTALLLLSLLAGCSLIRQDPPSVHSITMTDQVEPHSKAPIHSVTTFPKNTRQLYASVRVLRPRKGSKIEGRWYYDKDRKQNFRLVNSADVIFDRSSKERYVAFTLTSDQPFPPGAYKVEVLLEGQMAGAVEFLVE
jgi:hypothetical protein